MEMNARGFTLIEVLIAAVILFITLSTAAVSYQTIVSSNLRAENIVSVQTIIPLARMNIHQHLREKTDLGQQEQGNGAIGDWTYNWVANRVSYTPPAERFDPFLADFTEYKPRFHRFEITLTLNADDFSRTVSYEELAWNKNVATR